jgi:hypothetical protein
MDRQFHPKDERLGLRFPDADNKNWQIVEAWSYGPTVQMGFVAVCLQDEAAPVKRNFSLPLSYENAIDKIDMSLEEVQSIIATGRAAYLSCNLSAA